MNNRIEAKLTDLSGFNKAMNEVLQNAWERGRKYGQREMERPQGKWARHDEWVGGEYVGGFYHVNCPCEEGYYSKWETNFCPNCGQPMMKGGTE